LSAIYVTYKEVITMFIPGTAELPNPIEQHIQTFTAQRPDWTQARILNNALALFLLQNGVRDQTVSQIYLQSMFGELFAPASSEANGELS
jgi:hypothetical protein